MEGAGVITRADFVSFGADLLQARGMPALAWHVYSHAVAFHICVCMLQVYGAPDLSTLWSKEP